VSTTEGLLERKSSGTCLESREYTRMDLSRGTLYPQRLALTFPKAAVGGRLVRSRTQTTEFSFNPITHKNIKRQQLRWLDKYSGGGGGEINIAAHKIVQNLTDFKDGFYWNLSPFNPLK
jgi:hypothetical protein